MIKERTSWKSKGSARKGWVRWASSTEVCICLSPTDRDKTKVHKLADFLRLYEKDTPK